MKHRSPALPRIALAAGLALAVLHPTAAAAQKRPITHEDVFTAKRIGAPAVSPDGRWVVFQVTEPAYDEKEQVSDLWIAPSDGSAPPRQAVAHFEGEPLVIKHHPNSFRETNLLDLLRARNIERLVMTGMMTHLCVDATARAAADLGFQVIVVEDACATRDLKYGDTTIPADHVHKAFLAALKSYGRVMKCDETIASLAAEQVR